MSDQTVLLERPDADGSDFAATVALVPDGRPIGFGPFVALPAARSLMHSGVSVELGGRAFDLLMVLLRSRGEIVSKEEIFRYVWPCTTVDESNLRFQMAQLRKALGEGRRFIKTVQGRGYLLVAAGEKDRDVTDLDARPANMGRPAIFVIDEDNVVGDALKRLLSSFDAHVESFTCLEDLFERIPVAPRLPAVCFSL